MNKLPLFVAILLITGAAWAWDIDKKYSGIKTPTYNLAWHPDILEGYEARYVNLGEDFDGPCRSTIIRKLSDKPSDKAILYIHGFNDYFFQSEMGIRFVDSGFNFYAIDLRRYGRSREPWQYPFDIRNIEDYFTDIDSAIAQIQKDGNTDITLAGHSTGGLTVSLYGALRSSEIKVDRIVTNSPFLEWNYSAFMRNFAIPTVGLLGKFFKNAKIKQSQCDGYAYSLLKEYYGEWTYDTEWKMPYSPPVTASWVNAINSAQKRIRKKRNDINVPILIMHSSRTINGCNYTPEFQTGDAVLNSSSIQKIGNTLGKVRMVCTIDSGLHDLILSSNKAREATYDSIFYFIRHF